MLTLILAALSGCAGATPSTTSAHSAATSATAIAASAAPVALRLDTGSYSLTASSATVGGTVTRGATVRVNGRVAPVHAGRWKLTVALHIGGNRVAVVATMHGRAAARKTIEITRKASAPKAETPVAPTSETPVCTNGTYVNSAGKTVCRPEESPTAPAGATAECQDGTYSFSESRSGTCSHHGGVARWL